MHTQNAYIHYRITLSLFHSNRLQSPTKPNPNKKYLLASEANRIEAVRPKRETYHIIKQSTPQRWQRHRKSCESVRV